MQLSINDSKLIPAINRGDDSAFSVVFHHFAKQLHFFLYGMLKDHSIVEDIAAEAFIKTFERHGNFATMVKLKSFLFKTAGNAALDHIRATTRHKKSHAQIRYLAEETTEHAELAYIAAEAVRAVREAIDALPGKPREVIRMAYVDGKNLSEIAAALNISYNTVQNHRTRGLELLRLTLIKNDLLPLAVLSVALSLLDLQ